MKNIFAIATFFIAVQCCSQKSDTIIIDASKVKTSNLIPGVHRYLVYFKMGKDSSRKLYQLWTRSVSLTKYEGRDAIDITQEWEDNDSIIHTSKTVLDGKSFSTYYHESWWKGRGTLTFNFLKREAFVNNISLKSKEDSLSMKMLKAFEMATSQYFLNWHIDLEVFQILPYKEGVTFRISFYDPGLGSPRNEDYSVIGSGVLMGYDYQKIDCWLLKHGSLPRNQEIFWISKKTKEVLKLEQEFLGGRARYKIKLPFSN